MSDQQAIEALAARLARTERTLQGLMRVRQVERTVISSDDGDRELGDVVGELSETTETVGDLRDAALDERVGLDAEDLDRLREQSEGISDDVAEHGTWLAEQEDELLTQREYIEDVDVVASLASDAVDEAQAKADQAAQAALGAVTTAQNAATKAQEALDAAGRSVTASVIEYAVSDSKETAPTTGWSTDAPAPAEGEYVWMRTVVTYADETSAVSDPVLMSGGGSGEVVTLLGVVTYYANMVIPNQPPIPTENPPGDPWYPLKTPYQTGRRLYAADLAVYSDESFSWMNITIVQEWESAGQALEAAQRAQSTADGRNRIFAGATEPVEDPDAPFVGGDLWYRSEIREGQEVFAGVSMWDGAEWKDYRLIADSVLVPGSVGNILIEDGGISAEKIAATFYYGREFYGGLFEGGEFRLDSVSSVTELLHDPCETSGDWKGATGAPLSVSTAQAHEGTRSILVSNTGSPSWRFAERTITPVDLPSGGYVEAWVYATVAQRLTLYLFSDEANYSPALAVADIPAGVWTAITLNASPRLGASRIKLEGPQTSGSVYLDDVRVVKYDTFAGIAGITRDQNLRAVIYSADQGSQRVARFVQGELDISQGATKIYTDHTTDPWFGAVATLGIMAEARHLKITSRGLSSNSEIRLQGSRVYLDSPVTFAGDTDGPTPLPGTPSGASIGTEGVSYEIRSGWVIIKCDLTGTFTPGTSTYWNGVPAWLSPAEPSLIFAASYLGSAADVAFIRPNGTIGFANSSNANRTRCRFTLTYPLRTE
ncbi:hypothetical protein [Leucobacter sp. GX24907]